MISARKSESPVFFLFCFAFQVLHPKFLHMFEIIVSLGQPNCNFWSKLFSWESKATLLRACTHEKRANIFGNEWHTSKQLPGPIVPSVETSGMCHEFGNSVLHSSLQCPSLIIFINEYSLFCKDLLPPSFELLALVANCHHLSAAADANPQRQHGKHAPHRRPGPGEQTGICAPGHLGMAAALPRAARRFDGGLPLPG